MSPAVTAGLIPSTRLRGIGNGGFVGADPSVATFIDDVPHVYGSLVDDLVNVERVETDLCRAAARRWAPFTR